MVVQLVPHMFPMDKRNPEARLDKPWVVVADSGKLLIGRTMVEMDVMMSPFGTMTTMDIFLDGVGTC